MSTWGTSWGTVWGNSWGTTGTVFTTDNYFDKLGELGYSGTLADRQYQYLDSFGLTGATSRRKKDRLLALGYSGGSISKMLKEKTDAEGYKTVSEMMVKTGLIPDGN